MPAVQRAQQEAVAYVCYHANMDCSQVSYPRIRFYWGWDLGRFYPLEQYSDSIWLNLNLLQHLERYAFGDRTANSKFAYSVLLHETAHWLDYHVNNNMKHHDESGLPTTASLCRSEAFAWGISNSWAFENDSRSSPNWRQSYTHCWAGTTDED